MALYAMRTLLSATHLLTGDGDGDDDDEPLTDTEFIVFLTMSVFLVLMAGMMSGLTLGLMSLDMVELEVLKRSGTAEEKRCATVIMPVVKNQHFLLVTLLLCNAASTEALPLFIDRLADPFTAVVVSVSMVLVFGEILPQAICSRYGLKVGAYSAWFVRCLMFICAPIAWPIGKLLDCLLGSEHSALFRRAQLKALVDVHSSTAGFGGTLTEQEIAVIRGALDLTSKTAAKSMTPLDKVFMLSTEDRLDERAMQAILVSGHSRIPVYREGNRKDIVGLILSKELVLINPADNVPVSSLSVRDLPRLPADTPMYDMLKLFETGRSHMALLVRGGPSGTAGATTNPGLASGHLTQDDVRAGGQGRGKAGPDDQSIKRLGAAGTATPHTSSFRHGYGDLDSSLLYDGGGLGLGLMEVMEGQEGEPLGIITIEDVIEELLQEEIIDETDLFVDNLQTSRVNAAEVAGGLPPRLKKLLNAGLFTPRVGRLGAAQRFSMPPPMSDPVPQLPLSQHGYEALDGGAVALTVRPHAEGFPGAAASMGGAVAAATGRPPLPHGPVLPPPGTYSHGGASARRQRSARGAGLASVGGGAPPSLARTSVESNSSGGEDPKKPLLGLGGSSSDPAPL